MNDTQRRSHAVPLLCALSAILMVACKKDPSPAQPESAAASTAASGAATGLDGRQALPSCSIVSIAEVESTLGVQGLRGPEMQGEWPVRSCAFTRAPRNLAAVTVRFEVGRDAADFATIRNNHERAGQPTKDLPGLGDAAATVSMGDKPLGVTFLYKKTVVFVTAVVAPIDKQIALARIVLQRM
jgi:hypothetical protein